MEESGIPTREACCARYWLQSWITNNVCGMTYYILGGGHQKGRLRVREGAGAHRGLGCINGLRCASWGLRAESCEKTVACQFDVFGSGQMDTQSQCMGSSSKSAGTNPDLLLTSCMNQKRV